MKKSSYWMIAVILLILAGGLYYFLREEPVVLSPPAKQADTGNTPEMTFSGSSIVEEQGGQRLWELSADKITTNQMTNQVKFYGVNGNFYQENGSKVNVTAQEGVLDTTTKNITLTGNVRAVSSEGAVFTSAQAQWDGLQKHFFGSGGITFTREDVVITGDTVESDGGLNKVKVQGQARAQKGGLTQ